MTSSCTSRRTHVLLAEDHAAFRRLLAESFHAAGFDVTECGHGMELVEHIASLRDPARPGEYDLIVSDIRMPGVTGLSVLAGLHEMPHAPPVILITAFGDDATHQQARELGAAAIFDKPFDVSELILKARQILAL
jgi:CheY-like chemotaxis protein